MSRMKEALLGDTPLALYRGQRFNGADYEPRRDNPRLGAQIQRVFDAIKDGHWHTLAEIERITGDPPASISAQLRHLRKPRFGGHAIERRHVGSGLYEYRMGRGL